MSKPGKYHRWMEKNLEEPFLKAELSAFENPEDEKKPPLLGIIGTTVTLIILMAIWGSLS